MDSLVKKRRPRQTTGTTYRIEVGCGHLYIITGHNKDGELIEIFAKLGKSGGCAMSQMEGITRSVSLGLKYGIPIEEFVDQLEFIQCPSPSLSPNDELESMEEVKSCSDAIAKVLKKELSLVKKT